MLDNSSKKELTLRAEILHFIKSVSN